MVQLRIYFLSLKRLVHTTIGCGKQGFLPTQLYLSQYYEHSQNIHDQGEQGDFRVSG